VSWSFDRCADHLALDFANTVSERWSEAPIDRLPSYEELLRFAEQCGLVPAAEARRLREAARRHQDRATSALAGAVKLRDAMYDVFAAIAKMAPLPAAALRVLNKSVARIEIGPDLDWRWCPDTSGLDALLGPIVIAAADLLTSEARGRVRMCDGPACGWVFYDGSKNRSRRWCDMNQCGNRAKARRHYARSRAVPS
jgi:predicted RNA-binding Zn ribbon-like protein